MAPFLVRVPIPIPITLQATNTDYCSLPRQAQLSSLRARLRPNGRSPLCRQREDRRQRKFRQFGEGCAEAGVECGIVVLSLAGGEVSGFLEEGRDGWVELEWAFEATVLIDRWWVWIGLSGWVGQ